MDRKLPLRGYVGHWCAWLIFWCYPWMFEHNQWLADVQFIRAGIKYLYCTLPKYLGYTWVIYLLENSQISIKPSYAEATLVQSTRMQRFLKTMQTLSCWYSLDNSHWVLSDARLSTILKVFFASFWIDQIYPQQNKG